MQKRTSKKKLDTVQNARRVVLESVGEAEPQVMPSSIVSQVMAAMGAKGGRIGGKRRLETLSDERRREIATEAAKARWSKKRKKT
jgi:hypothetical protein